MTAINERTGTPQILQSAIRDRAPARLRAGRRHENAVIAAEVRRLARALMPQPPSKGRRDDVVAPPVSE
jgi:hypothetical protein